MKLIALAACFLFIFCQPPHRSVTKHSSCERFTKGYDSSVKRDDWVAQFPVKQQHRVLVCLDKLAAEGDGQ